MPDRDVFENHEAKYWKTNELGTRVERISFRNPKSSNYYIDFLSIGGDLVVRGDCYEAVYQVGYGHVMKWWANCDADYLSHKMRGINGPTDDNESWDENTAKKALEEIKKELEKEVAEDIQMLFESDGERDETLEQFKSRRELEIRDRDRGGAENRLIRWNEEDPFDSISSRNDWDEYLRNYGDDVLGTCSSEYYGIGLITNPQIALHLDGLRKAIKKLKEAGIQLLESDE